MKLIGLCFFLIASSLAETSSVESANGFRFDVSSTAKSSDCTIQVAVLTREIALDDSPSASTEDDEDDEIFQCRIDPVDVPGGYTGLIRTIALNRVQKHVLRRMWKQGKLVPGTSKLKLAKIEEAVNLGEDKVVILGEVKEGVPIDGSDIQIPTEIDVEGLLVVEDSNMYYNNREQDSNMYYNNRERELQTTSFGTNVGVKPVLVVKVFDVNNKARSESPMQISDDIFGTNGDPFNARSQLHACSMGRLDFMPGDNNSGLIDQAVYDASGVISVNIDISIEDSAKNDIQNAITVKVQEKLGIKLPGPYKHVMYIVENCYIDCGYAAYAYINSEISVYVGPNYKYVGVLVHELGHNFGLLHSGGLDGVKVYSDHTCMMGNPWAQDDFGRMCYNGAKNWQIGWYNDRKLMLSPLSNPPGSETMLQLVGVADYLNTNSIPVVLKLETGTDDDYFISFNRAAGVNVDNKQADDEVTIVKTGKNGVSASQSWLLTTLLPTKQFAISNYGNVIGFEVVITLDSIIKPNDGSSWVANIRISNSGTTHPPTKKPSAKPISARPSTTRPISVRPTATHPPTKKPSAKPISARPSTTRPISVRPTATHPPTKKPSAKPISARPSTIRPISVRPTATPSNVPTTLPTSFNPTASPSNLPTTAAPSNKPTILPTNANRPATPTFLPTINPSSAKPKAIPSASPTTSSPTVSPTVFGKPTATTTQPSLSVYPTAMTTSSYAPTAYNTGFPALATPSCVRNSVGSSTNRRCMSRNGIMFDVIAKNTSIAITGIGIDVMNGTSAQVWTKVGSSIGFESSIADWTMITEFSFSGDGLITIPLTKSLTVNAGLRQALYVTMATENSYLKYGANYTNDSASSVAFEDPYLALYPGAASKYLFGDHISPRFFTGRIEYFLVAPTPAPIEYPTDNPTTIPTESPSMPPTASPTPTPSSQPTKFPTARPTLTPTVSPTWTPTVSPTASPTADPTRKPSSSPSKFPTINPTAYPTANPTFKPSSKPTSAPTAHPTKYYTSSKPTTRPNSQPTNSPTSFPTTSPSKYPTTNPTTTPTSIPTNGPSSQPTNLPTISPTATSSKPTIVLTLPSSKPSSQNQTTTLIKATSALVTPSCIRNSVGSSTNRRCMSRNGIMFDVIAKNTSIAITGIAIDVMNGTSAQVWTKVGSSIGFESSIADWTMITEFSFSGDGLKTIPLTKSLTVNAGLRQALYVTMATENSYLKYGANYTNDSASSVAFEDPYLALYPGAASKYLFGDHISPRFFTGRIEYFLVAPTPAPTKSPTRKRPTRKPTVR